MFLQVSVCPQGGWVSQDALQAPPPPPDGEPPLDGDPPGMENPPGLRTPPGWSTPRDGEPPRSMCGRYASYWNAFLSMTKI